MQGSFGLPSLAAIQLEETAGGGVVETLEAHPVPPYTLA